MAGKKRTPDFLPRPDLVASPPRSISQEFVRQPIRPVSPVASQADCDSLAKISTLFGAPDNARVHFRHSHDARWAQLGRDVGPKWRSDRCGGGS